MPLLGFGLEGWEWFSSSIGNKNCRPFVILKCPFVGFGTKVRKFLKKKNTWTIPITKLEQYRELEVKTLANIYLAFLTTNMEAKAY